MFGGHVHVCSDCYIHVHVHVCSDCCTQYCFVVQFMYKLYDEWLCVMFLDVCVVGCCMVKLNLDVVLHRKTVTKIEAVAAQWVKPERERGEGVGEEREGEEGRGGGRERERGEGGGGGGGLGRERVGVGGRGGEREREGGIEGKRVLVGERRERQRERDYSVVAFSTCTCTLYSPNR